MTITNILEALTQHKAKDILTLDVSQKTPLIDTIVICTATSSRHAKSLAELLIQYAKKQQQLVIGVEGLDYGEWVLVKLEGILIHIMLNTQRDFYQIEQVWILPQENLASID